MNDNEIIATWFKYAQEELQVKNIGRSRNQNNRKFLDTL